MNTQRHASPAIFTVGHSTRPIEAFLELLRAHGIERVVDVRTVPRSRHNPQFSREALAAALRRAGIAYTHLKELGGLRHARPDSGNVGWRNASFRGFADYMQTGEFEAGLARLMDLAERSRCAILCAEAVPWRCHRSLIADALAACGIAVEHILSGARRQPHRMTPFAKVRGKRVTYPAAAGGDGGSHSNERVAERKPENEGEMAEKKRKKRKFTAAKEARRVAREVTGAPPAERVIPDKRRKPPKHKKRPEQEEEG